MSLQVKIYEKGSKKSFINKLKESLSGLVSSFFLARQWAIRDIKSQYRQSYLGILWAFISPLTTGAVWVFLNLTGTIRLTDTGIAYPVYAFAGTLIWSIIVASINLPMNATNAAKGILSKINFPKEALLVSGVLKLVFESSIKILMLLGFLVVFDVGFHSSLLLFPIALLGIILVGLSIGLLICPLGLLYKDVAKLVGLGLSFLMYLTPVVYVIPKEGVLKFLMEINPFTYLITATRDLLVGNAIVFLNEYILVIVFSIPVFLIGLVFYRVSIPIIVERLSA